MLLQAIFLDDLFTACRRIAEKKPISLTVARFEGYAFD